MLLGEKLDEQLVEMLVERLDLGLDERLGEWLGNQVWSGGQTQASKDCMLQLCIKYTVVIRPSRQNFVYFNLLNTFSKSNPKSMLILREITEIVLMLTKLIVLLLFLSSSKRSKPESTSNMLQESKYLHECFKNAKFLG